MRQVRYLSPDGHPDVPRSGVVDGGTIRGGVAGGLPEPVPLDEARLLPPIATPPSVRDFMAFEQHVDGMGLLVGVDPTVPDVWYRQPLFYFSNPAGLLGPHDDVPVPPGCAVFDFELEVAAVIGPLPGRADLADLTLAEAAQAIAGYVLMNDWSARDLQAAEMTGPLGPCKGKDSAITLGPWLVSADELPGLAHGESGVKLSAAVNGEPFGQASLDSMAWSSRPTPPEAPPCARVTCSVRAHVATAAWPSGGDGRAATPSRPSGPATWSRSTAGSWGAPSAGSCPAPRCASRWPPGSPASRPGRGRPGQERPGRGRSVRAGREPVRRVGRRAAARLGRGTRRLRAASGLRRSRSRGRGFSRSRAGRGGR